MIDTIYVQQHTRLLANNFCLKPFVYSCPIRGRQYRQHTWLSANDSRLKPFVYSCPIRGRQYQGHTWLSANDSRLKPFVYSWPALLIPNSRGCVIIRVRLVSVG